MNAGRYLIVGIVGAALVMQTGCSMAVKEARGASAKVMVIKDAKDLESYRTVALHTLKTDLGKQCPKDMLRTLENTLKDEFELVKGSDASDAPVLRIDAKVNYYQKGGGVKAVLGTQSRCHVRLALRGGGDKLVADLLVPGASSAVMRAGHDDLAKAITKSVLKYLDKRGLRSPKSEEDDDEDSEDEEESTSVASNTDSAENDGD